MLAVGLLLLASHGALAFKSTTHSNYARLSSTSSKQSSTLLSSMRKKYAFSPEVGIEVDPRRFRKSTKQLSTLGIVSASAFALITSHHMPCAGPASNTFEMVEKLFLSGSDMCAPNPPISYGS